MGFNCMLPVTLNRMLPVTFASSQAFDSELKERFYSRLIYKRNLAQRKNIL